MTALRQLASTCEFANGDDMIRDQLVEHVAHARIRERLLLKQKLTLEDAVTIASQMESAGEQAKCMTKSGLPVQAVQVHSTTSTAMEKCASGVIYRSVHNQFHSCYKFPFLLSLWIRQASGKCPRNAQLALPCVKLAIREDILAVCVGLLHRLTA